MARQVEATHALLEQVAFQVCPTSHPLLTPKNVFSVLTTVFSFDDETGKEGTPSKQDPPLESRTHSGEDADLCTDVLAGG